MPHVPLDYQMAYFSILVNEWYKLCDILENYLTSIYFLLFQAVVDGLIIQPSKGVDDEKDENESECSDVEDDADNKMNEDELDKLLFFYSREKRK